MYVWLPDQMLPANTVSIQGFATIEKAWMWQPM